MSLTDVLNAANSAQNFLNGISPTGISQQQSFLSDGFQIPATFEASGNGLPYNNVPSSKPGQLRRNIITWFVPQFGTVSMYVNPESIIYEHSKQIGKDRTKGGFTLQYWGENLTSIKINGTTGSSGIEGINALYELYRAEQYAFDTTGLNLAANNSNNSITQSLLGGASSLFGASSGAPTSLSGMLGSVLGLSSPTSNLSPQNIPSLAQLAFTVEMYYGGWVYRGFFENMTITETSNDFLIKYSINFTATQRRGYRTNYFPFTRAANAGSSQYTTPNALSGHVTG